MQASAHARDHHYAVRAGFDARRPAARRSTCRAVCNAGAYSVFPWTAGIEALMAGGLLTGPYKLQHYRCEVTARGHAHDAGRPVSRRGAARPRRS